MMMTEYCVPSHDAACLIHPLDKQPAKTNKQQTCGQFLHQHLPPLNNRIYFHLCGRSLLPPPNKKGDTEQLPWIAAIFWISNANTSCVINETTQGRFEWLEQEYANRAGSPLPSPISSFWMLQVPFGNTKGMSLNASWYYTSFIWNWFPNMARYIGGFKWPPKSIYCTPQCVSNFQESDVFSEWS